MVKEIIDVGDDEKSAKTRMADAERREKMADVKKDLKILIKDPTKSALRNINRQIIRLKNDAQLLISGYLCALGHGDGKFSIDGDFNFITIINEEKKEDGKETDG